MSKLGFGISANTSLSQKYRLFKYSFKIRAWTWSLYCFFCIRLLNAFVTLCWLIPSRLLSRQNLTWSDTLLCSFGDSCLLMMRSKNLFLIKHIFCRNWKYLGHYQWMVSGFSKAVFMNTNATFLLLDEENTYGQVWKCPLGAVNVLCLWI